MWVYPRDVGLVQLDIVGRVGVRRWPQEALDHGRQGFARRSTGPLDPGLIAHQLAMAGSTTATLLAL